MKQKIPVVILFFLILAKLLNFELFEILTGILVMLYGIYISYKQWMADNA
jgi:hypothetical protein